MCHPTQTSPRSFSENLCNIRRATGIIAAVRKRPAVAISNVEGSAQTAGPKNGRFWGQQDSQPPPKTSAPAHARIAHLGQALPTIDLIADGPARSVCAADSCRRGSSTRANIHTRARCVTNSANRSVLGFCGCRIKYHQGPGKEHRGSDGLEHCNHFRTPSCAGFVAVMWGREPRPHTQSLSPWPCLCHARTPDYSSAAPRVNGQKTECLYNSRNRLPCLLHRQLDLRCGPLHDRPY